VRLHTQSHPQLLSASEQEQEQEQERARAWARALVKREPGVVVVDEVGDTGKSDKLEVDLMEQDSVRSKLQDTRCLKE
jgi:hypoxanthine phosphoribosyltransferase